MASPVLENVVLQRHGPALQLPGHFNRSTGHLSLVSIRYLTFHSSPFDVRRFNPRLPNPCSRAAAPCLRGVPL